MQGVVKSYDPTTRNGSIIHDTTMSEYELAANALEGSVFRMLRPGQRVVFSLNQADEATRLNLGSEQDMATPATLPEQ